MSHSEPACGGSVSTGAFRNSPLLEIIHHKIGTISLAPEVSPVTELLEQKADMEPLPFPPPAHVETHPGAKRSSLGASQGQRQVFTHLCTEFYLLVFYCCCGKLGLAVNRRKT